MAPRLGAVFARAKRVASVRVRAHHHHFADEITEGIRAQALNYGCMPSGMVRLPTRRKSMSLLRSVHVNKKSQERFQSVTYSRLFDVYAVESSAPGALAADLFRAPPMGAMVSMTMRWEEPFEHVPNPPATADMDD